MDDPACRQVVLERDFNLLELLPLCKINEHDGGFYLSKASVVSNDPDRPGDLDTENVGIYRLQVLDPDTLAMQALAVSRHRRSYPQGREARPAATGRGLSRRGPDAQPHGEHSAALRPVGVQVQRGAERRAPRALQDLRRRPRRAGRGGVRARGRSGARRSRAGGPVRGVHRGLLGRPAPGDDQGEAGDPPQPIRSSRTSTSAGRGANATRCSVCPPASPSTGRSRRRCPR